MKKILFGIVVFSFASIGSAFAEDEINIIESDVISVYDKLRPDYDPRGIRTKSFVIRPSLELEGRFDDNIYAEESDTEEDFISIIRPVVDIGSKWSRHRVDLLIGGEFGLYSDNGDEDYEDYFVELDTRFDIANNTYIKPFFSYNREHEERGSPEFPATAAEPIEYDDFFANLMFYHSPGKMSFKTAVGYRNIDYKDNQTILGAPLDQDYRDRNEYFGYVKLGYEFIPNYEAFIEVGGDIREYDRSTSSAKDSESYYVIGGTEVNISGKARGRIYAGYMERDYDSSAYESIDGVKIGGDILWNITELTSLMAGLSRSIEETFLTDYSGYELTSAELRLEHELRRNILLAATGGWDNYAYEGTPTPEREDDIITGGLEAKYLINRNLSAGVGYQYTNRDSNIDGDDYDKNVFMIKAKAAF